MFDFLLFSILFSGCCCFLFLLLSYLLFLKIGNLSKTCLKNLDIAKKPKMKHAQKKDILTKAVSTQVLTNSVFFSFLCFFKFCIFLLKTL